jgi:hypothetical protein
VLSSGYVSEFLQKGPEIGEGQGISEKLFADNFEPKEMNRWPDPRLSEKESIGKNCWWPRKTS